MIDKELFELCKQVFKATGWDAQDRYWSHDGSYLVDKNRMTSIEFQTAVIPLYTSDYLLEKLPPVIFTRTSDGHNPTGILTVWVNGDKTSHAAYVIPYDEQHRADHAQTSDTTRKALLKLVLALSKAGVEL